MLREQAFEYRRIAASLILEAPKDQRREVLDILQADPDYKKARILSQAARQRFQISKGLLKPHTTDHLTSSDLGTEEQHIEKNKHDTAWANEVVNKYLLMPKGTRKEKQLTEKYLKGETGKLLSSPESISTVAMVWKGFDQDDEHKSFYEIAKSSIFKNSRGTWGNVSSDSLAGLIKVASHDKYSADFSKTALAGYFKGGQSSADVATAMHKFMIGASTLGLDYQSLQLAYEVSLFMDPGIVADSSVFAMNYLLKANFGFTDKSNYRKILSVGYYSGMIAPLLGRDLKTDNAALLKRADSIVPRESVRKATQQLVSAVGADKATELVLDTTERVADYDKGLEVLTTRKSKLVEFVGYTPSSDAIVTNPNSNLTEVRNYYLESKLYSDAQEVFPGQSLTVHYFPIGSKRFAFMILPISLPSDDLAKLQDKIVIENAEGSDQLGYRFTELTNETPLGYLQGRPDKIRFRALGSLSVLGTPVLTPDGLPVSLKNTGDAAQKLYEDQRIFLDQRGVKVDLSELENFANFGFRSMTFRKLGSGASIEIEGDTFRHMSFLDRYFNLLRNPKEFSSPMSEENLYFLAIQALSGILTREPKNGGEPKLEGLLEIIARMPHLRLLPTGQNFSDEARKNYFEEKGLDLKAKSESIKSRNASDPEKADRNTTYVKAVKKDGYDSLPPIDMKISSIVPDLATLT